MEAHNFFFFFLETASLHLAIVIFFYSVLQDINSQLWENVRIVSWLSPPLKLDFITRNFEVISHNCEKKSKNWLAKFQMISCMYFLLFFISHFWLFFLHFRVSNSKLATVKKKKKSLNCKIISHLPFPPLRIARKKVWILRYIFFFIYNISQYYCIKWRWSLVEQNVSVIWPAPWGLLERCSWSPSSCAGSASTPCTDGPEEEAAFAGQETSSTTQTWGGLVQLDQTLWIWQSLGYRDNCYNFRTSPASSGQSIVL